MALAVAGIGVSAYLTAAHYSSPKVLACSDRGTIDCTKVTTSSYAVQHGIPLAVLGLAFFAATFALHLPRAWRSPLAAVRWGRMGLATAGAAGAVWLIWVELFRLDAICLYCTVVHALAVALFVLTGIATASAEPGDELDASDPAPAVARR